MVKKILTAIVSILLFLNISGCALLLVGAASGAGTAVWLSGKLVQDVNVPMDHSIEAVHSGLKALKIDIEKETKTEDVAQIISKYTDGKTIWIDVRKVSDSASKIEVRVGAVGDKDAAHKVLEKIKRYL